MISKKSVRNVFYGFWSVVVVLILTFVDQWTKLFAIDRLKDQDAFSIIPGILEFRYLENRGMAFGMMSGKILFFLMICIIYFIFAIYFYIRIPKTKFYYPVIGIELVLSAGAIGNFIDRLWRGYVVDFIYVKCIDFPIFNVADIYVVTSCFLMIILIIFKYEDDDFKFLKLKHKE